MELNLQENVKRKNNPGFFLNILHHDKKNL